ncbi:hypothetical protein [Ferdinandcohnia sp. Marseille-Q9671]
MKLIRYGWLLLSGLFVLVFSLWMSGPGIGETDTPEYRWYFMLLFLLWVTGSIVQLKKRSRVMGLTLTVVPVGFYLFLYLTAVFY